MEMDTVLQLLILFGGLSFGAWGIKVKEGPFVLAALVFVAIAVGGLTGFIK